MLHRLASFHLPLLGLVAASVLWASPASAADLDPGYADVPQQMPEQQVTFGSGWYIRGDMGATENYQVLLGRPAVNEVAFGLDKTHSAGYDVSLGGGYAFTNQFRSDITVDFHQQVQNNVLNQQCLDQPKLFNCQTKGYFDHYDALINGYYDIGTWSIFTPYVGAGIGVGFGEVKAYLLNDTTLYEANLGYHNLAWALMGGVAVDVYQHTKLDVGYRYLNNGSVLGTKVTYQEVRAGLRYMIDN